MLNVVKRPFKTNGKWYPAGAVITDPAGIPLLKTKIREGKIVLVDEHNLDSIATYLKHRRGVDNAHATLKSALYPDKENTTYSNEYIERVKKASVKYNIDMTDKSIDEVVAEIKAFKASKSR